MSTISINIPIDIIPEWHEDEPNGINVDVNIVSDGGERVDTIYTVSFSFTEDGSLQLSCYEVSNPHESTANIYPEYRQLHQENGDK